MPGEAANPPNAPPPRASTATRGQVLALGLAIVLLGLALGAVLVLLWPPGPGKVPATALLFPALDPDVRLLLIVMTAGALGSFIHAATSFGDFVGNGKLTANWIWWYVLKPFIGMALAVVLYLTMRGGFLGQDAQAEHINYYGVAALAGLAGMFSKQATDKLSEVFSTLFRTQAGAGDDQRKDSLSNPVPVLNDLEPRQLEPATRSLVVDVKGSNFVQGAVVRINGTGRETEFRDETRLVAKLLQEDVTNEGELDVRVLNPSPGGGTSAALKLRVAAQSGTAAASPPDDAHADGCDVAVLTATPDEQLPAAVGGVAAS